MVARTEKQLLISLWDWTFKESVMYNNILKSYEYAKDEVEQWYDLATKYDKRDEFKKDDIKVNPETVIDKKLGDLYNKDLLINNNIFFSDA